MTGISFSENTVKNILFFLLRKVFEENFSLEEKLFEKFKKDPEFQRIKEEIYSKEYIQEGKFFCGSLGEILGENSLFFSSKDFNLSFLSGIVFKNFTLFPGGNNFLIYFYENTFRSQEFTRWGLKPSQIGSLLKVLSFLYNAFNYEFLKKDFPVQLLQEIGWCVWDNFEYAPHIRKKILDIIKNDLQSLKDKVRKKLPIFLAKKPLREDFFLTYQPPLSPSIMISYPCSYAPKPIPNSLLIVVENYPFAHVDWDRKLKKLYQAGITELKYVHFEKDYFLFLFLQKGESKKIEELWYTPIRLVVIMLSFGDFVDFVQLHPEKDAIRKVLEFLIKFLLPQHVKKLESSPELKERMIKKFFNLIVKVKRRLRGGEVKYSLNLEKSTNEIKEELKKELKDYLNELLKIKKEKCKTIYKNEKCLACEEKEKLMGKFCENCYTFRKNYALHFFKTLKNLQLLEKFFTCKITEKEWENMRNEIKNIPKFRGRTFEFIKKEALKWLGYYIKFCDEKTKKETLQKNKVSKWLEAGRYFDKSLTKILESIPKFKENPLKWKDEICAHIKQEICEYIKQKIF